MILKHNSTENVPSLSVLSFLVGQPRAGRRWAYDVDRKVFNVSPVLAVHAALALKYFHRRRAIQSPREHVGVKSVHAALFSTRDRRLRRVVVLCEF